MTKAIQERNLVEEHFKLYEFVFSEIQKNPATPKSDLLYYQFMRDYYANILTAREQNKPLVLYNIYSQCEILYAMDLVPYLQGHLNLITPLHNDCTDFFDLSKGHGVPSEICSYERLRLGMTLAKGLIPPDFMVVTNLYCTGNHMMLDYVSELCQVPIFSYDCPYNFDDEGVKYYIGQLKELISFLEEQTKRKLDYDRLREIVKQSKMATQWYDKIGRIKGAVPAPSGATDYFRDLELTILGVGTEAASNFLEAHYQELKARVDKKQGMIPNEKYRIAWWGGIPFFDPGFWDWVAQEFQAAWVADIFDINVFHCVELIGDPDDPLEYIARRIMTFPINFISREYSRVKDYLVQAARERQANASVAYAPFTCKQLALLTRFFKDNMVEEVGIPTLILDGDYLDKSIISTSQMKGRLSEFFDMLEKQTP